MEKSILHSVDGKKNLLLDRLPELLPISFSPVDVKKILNTFALWQQEMDSRSVLLASFGKMYSAQGFGFPYPVDLEGKALESENELADPRNIAFDRWDSERSKLMHIVVGQMSRRSKASLWSIDEIPIQLLGSLNSVSTKTLTDTSTCFRAEYLLSSIWQQRSYWDISFQPKTGPAQSNLSSTAWIAGKAATFVPELKTDSLKELTLLVGPIIGNVTDCSAVVLLEFADTCLVELVCIDQINGTEYLCCRKAFARRPCIFFFDRLPSNRPFNVKLNNPLSAVLGPSMEQYAKQIHTIVGSFTTLRSRQSKAAFDEHERQKYFALRDALESVQGDHSGSSAGSVESWSALDLFDSLVISENKGIGNSASSLNSDNFRIVLVGSNQPSLMRLLPEQDPEDWDFSTTSNDRSNILRGIALLNRLSDLSSEYWNGVDFIIHVGSSIDYSSVLAETLKLLYLAEECNMELGSNSIMEREKLAEASQSMRNACRYHWGVGGNSQYSTLLSNGNHYFIASPMFDLLVLLNANSLLQVSRELSPYCTQNLVDIISEIQNDYYHQREVSSLTPDEYPFSTFLLDTRVVLFELCPKMIFSQSSSRASEGLISNYQFKALRNLLEFLSDSKNISDDDRVDTTTLLLSSPVPLVMNGDATNSLLGGMAMRYSSTEIGKLFDMLAKWMEKDNTREVVIVAGGVSSNFSTEITSYQKLSDTTSTHDDVRSTEVCFFMKYVFSHCHIAF